jgi:hypothetical protein
MKRKVDDEICYREFRLVKETQKALLKMVLELRTNCMEVKIMNLIYV